MLGFYKETFVGRNRTWKAVGLAATACFLSAILFGTIHLAAHYPTAKDTDCSFCRYYTDFHAESAAPGISDARLPPAGNHVIPTAHCSDFSTVLPRDARAPPIPAEES